MLQAFRPWLVLSLLLLNAVSQADVLAKDTQTCYKATTAGRTYSYCIDQAAGSINSDVLYFFHGAYGSAQDWGNSVYHQRIYDAWGAQAPIVVSVSYGSLWLLAEKNSSSRSGLYDHFLNSALPAIEKALELKPTHRLLVGLSMGGFNAAQLYLKKPELFSKVALLCPALADLNPYADDDQIEAYVDRTNANRSAVLNLLYLTQTYFPSRDAYKTADPFLLARTHPNPQSPPLFVTVGLQDDYGFFEGSSQFVNLETSNGADATYDPLAGRHCTWDWKSATQFIIEP